MATEMNIMTLTCKPTFPALEDLKSLISKGNYSSSRKRSLLYISPSQSVQKGQRSGERIKMRLKEWTVILMNDLKKV